MSAQSEKVNAILKTLTDKPGVYQYYDADGRLLYVGKAKNLKKRVSSYFNKVHDSSRLRILVKNISDIKTIIVETEFDALLLENNLIKQHQPKYNINLKDDKTYPWIVVKNEAFPRVFVTRNKFKDGSQYFGPFASVKTMNTLLDLIKQLYPIRTCKLNLSESNIKAGKFNSCLEFHIGRCKAPCIGKQSKADYDSTIAEIKQIIKGNIGEVNLHLKTLMNQFAAQMEFEKAFELKEKIDILEKYQNKSAVVSTTITNVDVFSIVHEEKQSFVNYLKVIEGAIVQSYTLELKTALDESQEEVLTLAIVELRQRFQSLAREIIVPFELDIELPNASFIIPVRGDKKQLLEFSEKNAKYAKLEKLKQSELKNPELKIDRVLETMKKDLRLTELPRHIECFDNSNIQGNFPVSACVVFKNAKPSKKDYRHFNVKTVIGPDDFATMEEVVYRRYKRLVEENQELPQLIVIDGGKGQLGAAIHSLNKLNLMGKIAIIGIAKRLEELYYPGDPYPLHLDKKSETLRIIQQMRDEAHRFGITHHRDRRSKGTIKTELTEIEGIGEKTANELLKVFKSVKKLKETGIEDIAKIIGPAKAQVVFDYFASKNA